MTSASPQDPPPLIGADWLINLIGSARLDLSTEGAVQRGLARLFEEDQVPYEAEVILAPSDRIDFLIGRVGIEVKIGHPRRAILRQLERYARSDRVDTLLLVSSAPFPSAGFELRGKPVHIVSLSVGWL
jgi:hypothetical protein